MAAPPMTPAGAPLAFLKKVVANTPPDDDLCILWPFARAGKKKRYGQVIFNGRMTTANNAVCEIAHGPAPTPAHESAHRCGNSPCINPNHVRWALPAENEADKITHGTSWLERDRDRSGRFL